MGLKGDGYKIIADKFQIEAPFMRLIGITVPDSYPKFVGIFDTLTDLGTAYPAADQPVNTIAGVRQAGSQNDTFFWYQVIQIGTKGWVPKEEPNLTGEGFYQSAIQPVVFSATDVTNTNESGLPLRLSQSYTFDVLSQMPANSLGIVIQGIRFEKRVTTSPLVYEAFYDWGLKPENWDAFTEQGEYIVSSWNLKVGGLPTE